MALEVRSKGYKAYTSSPLRNIPMQISFPSDLSAKKLDHFPEIAHRVLVQ
jgi:hypothetical protein